MFYPYIRFKRGARVRETMSGKYAEGIITVPLNSPTPQWLDLDWDMVHVSWDVGGSSWVPFVTVEVI